MNNSFAFSEVVRKLVNLIRLGKIVEINGNEVKVRIGQVTTGWLPIISTAGEVSCWLPISVGEQVVVFAPYGELALGFVLRAIHYDDYKIPENTGNVDIKTPFPIKIKGENGLSSEFDKNFSVKVGSATINLGENSIQIKNGSSSISLSDDSITLQAGSCSVTIGGIISLTNEGSSIDIGSAIISLGSGDIITTPPVCKCSGGL